MTTRAAIYVRISDDPGDLKAGVARQEEDCRGVCAERGWVVTEVFEDNDRSAYQGKPRPAFERMLAVMASGGVDVVVMWHQDRLTRNPMELEQVMEIARSGGIPFVTPDTEVDLVSRDGRFQARIVGAVAANESDAKSERIRRKHLQLAADGKVSGGGWRPFGYEKDRKTIRESEALPIRDAARRLVAGESQGSILRDWAAQGILTTAGNAWTVSSFKRMMLSPRIAGIREHHGTEAGPAEWEGIIDGDTHRRLQARLKGTGASKGNRQRSYLLTGGLAVCGLCGAALAAQPHNQKRSMVCPTGPGRAGCGRIRIAADPIEAFIGGAVIEALDGPMLIEAIRADQETDNRDAVLAERIATLQANLEQAAVDHYTGDITRAEFQAARKALEAQIESLHSKLSRNGRGRILTGLPTGRDALQAAWDQADVGWRRGLVAAVVDRIEVRPAVRGRTTFDPNRLNINWHA